MIKTLFTVIIPIIIIILSAIIISVGIIKLISKRNACYLVFIGFGIIVLFLVVLQPIIISIMGVVLLGSFLLEDC